jgi:hypothetical protein
MDFGLEKEKQYFLVSWVLSSELMGFHLYTLRSQMQDVNVDVLK